MPSISAAQYVSLHTHTDRSFLDGQQSVIDLAGRARELNQAAVAITDHQEVGGHLAFQKACRDVDVKPIFGMEGYLVEDVETTRRDKHKVSSFSHITLLAQNNDGLANLWNWSSTAYTQNFYHRALSDWQMAKELGDGLYATDGCLLSFMAMAVIDGDTDRQHQLMGRYLEIFDERFLMELHTFQIIDPVTERHRELNEQMTAVNQRKVELANEYGVPLIVVNDAHYARQEDADKHALVWEMGTSGGKKKAEDQTGSGHAASWVMGDEEVVHWMNKHGIPRSVTEEAIRNTAIVAADCNAEIKSELRMPRMTRSDRDDMKMFLDQVEEGFRRKVIETNLDTEVYNKQMVEEVRTITRLGFHGYFNVVADYCKYAKQDLNMLVGPGRGSGGGSLVAWLQDITEVDPIKYDLDFNRFISPNRKGLPDIDLDFPRSRRGEIKGYLERQFGHDCVCTIGTRGVLAPKVAVNDVARAKQVPIPDARAITKIMDKAWTTAHTPEGEWADMKDDKATELAPWMRKWPALFAGVDGIVGMTRQSGTHPSGILVSAVPLDRNLPMRKKGKDGAITTQFDMDEVEEMGFVKMDILGLRHLDTLQFAMDLIYERHGIRLNFYNFGDKEYADPAIWPAITEGKTLGIFQLESHGGTSATMAFKPENERDVMDLISINRPGVIDAKLDKAYYRRRAGLEEVVLDHPMMEPIVGKTMGIQVYQEQNLRVVRELAGFNADEADSLRKILARKQGDKIPPWRDKFFAAVLANKEFVDTAPESPKVCAEKIWASIEASARYNFNRAHAIAYAMIPSWEIWLKHYYFPEFITALLATDEEKTKSYIREARGKGIAVTPPHINESGETFTLTPAGIRFGLGAVRQVGGRAVEEIVSKRDEGGPFLSMANFYDRCAKGIVNIRVVANLISIGAFDEFGGRAELLGELYDQRKPKEIPPIPDFTSEVEVAALEDELIGTWITYDPLGPWQEMIESQCIGGPAEMLDADVGSMMKIGGIVTGLRPTVTKGGKPMAFAEVTKNDDVFNLLVFPEAWETNRPFLKEGVPVIVRAIALEDGAAHVVTTIRLDYLD